MNIEYTDKAIWIHCGEALLLEMVIPEKEILKKVFDTNKPILIDASKISKIDAAGMQLILNFVLEASRKNLSINWQSPSEVLIEKAFILGMNRLLDLRGSLSEFKIPETLSPVLSTFIEESSENLKDMEECLLSINLEALDLEKINQIFRTIHTFKGNCSLFGFIAVKECTHTVETLLDEIRSGSKKLESIHVDYLLKTVDFIKTFLSDIQKTNYFDETSAKHLNEIFQELIRTASSPTEHKEAILGWHIVCVSNRDLFKKKLEPDGAFESIKKMGALEITADPKNLPGFFEFDPSLCYLSWELILYKDIPNKEANDILSWIFDEKDITIEPILSESEKESQRKTRALVPSQKDMSIITSIRVPVEKIETVLNSVSELVIIESMFKQVIEDTGIKSNKLYEILDHLDKNSKELEDHVLHVRMVPLAFLVNRFPRTVFDLAKMTNKEVDFIINGENNELDKNIIEKITDPLLHLIRNAVDHGIESPKERELLGKDKNGIVKLNCYQEGEYIIIEISDDGTGIDIEKIRRIALDKNLIKKEDELSEQEIYQLLFRPGFSSAKIVSEVSGRGVGLDVVENNIHALGGNVQVNSTLGKGTVFKLTLPLTSAIIECQLIQVSGEVYIIPLREIIEIMKLDHQNIIIKDNEEFYHYHKADHRIIYLTQVLNLKNTLEPNQKNLNYVIIVSVKENNFALVCDDLLLQQRVVVKNIEENFCKTPGVSGATILGDGSIGLILDLQKIIEISLNKELASKLSTGSFFKNENKESTKSKKLDKKTKDHAVEYLCFLLNHNEYGINITEIREIHQWKKPNFIPFSDSFLMGMIDFRGTIIPIIDLSNFLGFKPVKHQLTTIFIIVNIQKNNRQKTIGLAVDNLPDTRMIYDNDIKSLHENEFEEKPLVAEHYISGLVKIENKIVTMLNIKNIISFDNPLGEENEITI